MAVKPVGFSRDLARPGIRSVIRQAILMRERFPADSRHAPGQRGQKVLAEALHRLISIVRRKSHQTLAIISSTRAESFAWQLRKRGGIPYNNILHAAAEQ